MTGTGVNSTGFWDHAPPKSSYPLYLGPMPEHLEGTGREEMNWWWQHVSSGWEVHKGQVRKGTDEILSQLRTDILPCNPFQTLSGR